jgi:predicted acylesterase/phospholipase RssA
MALPLVLAIVVGFWNDNHAIRKYEPEASNAWEAKKKREESMPWSPDQRPSIESHFEEWLTVRFGGITHSGQTTKKDYPVFVVAAEGGGIRAAYWTAAVLSNLQKEFKGGHFACHLYAVSGVSGGSLGAASYVAYVANSTRNETIKCMNESGDSDIPIAPSTSSDVTLKFLENDFLAPAVAGMMTSDLLSRINPLCVPSLGLMGTCLRDRAAYLEHAWEVEWDALMENTNNENPVTFAGPFHVLWTRASKDGDPKNYAYDVPSLFLNGTWVETGNRSVTSNLRIDTGPKQFTDLDDTLEWLDSPIRLSTAVLNSARFTYVSPPGTVSKDGRRRKIVDGGYFENSGAQTAREITATIRKVCERNELCAENGVRIVALILTNNPKRNASKWRADGEQLCAIKDQGDAPEESSTANLLPEVTSPIITMFNTREARGRLAEGEFAEENEKQRTFRFALRKKEGVELPLGWYLSEEAQTEIKAQAQNAVEKCSTLIWNKNKLSGSRDGV